MEAIVRENKAHQRANVVRALLLGAAIVLVLTALIYNEFTLAPLARDEFSQLTREKIRSVELGLAMAGLLLFGASEAVRRSVPLARRLSGRAPEIALFLLAGILPFAIVDLGLRPFVVPKTSLFVEDPALGWRMKANAESEWGQVRISTNARGLRGPDVPYAKRLGVPRVVFLGDSVTYGYGIEQTADVFTYLAGQELTSALGVEVETVNAGVGGYSPWQERIFFEREGLRYDPDLVVVGFVLNDVAEKFTLSRFGGTGEGWQLERTARGALDQWLSASALATTLREGVAELRFGQDVRLGALAAETAEVQRVALNPDAERKIDHAWNLTFANLAGLLDTAAAARVPALIVVFPYTFQLEEPPEDADPQRRLREFAEARGTPLLDLLPLFAEDGESQRLMLDDSHLSAEGHALAAAAIAEIVIERRLLAAGEGQVRGQ